MATGMSGTPPRAAKAKTAFLGLGGNIGDVVATMRGALDYLHGQQGFAVVNISPLYKTPPWGFEDQDWFVNGCVSVSCTLPPMALLEACLAAEAHLHRVRTVRWGPRTIDIDVLIYDGFASDDEVLTVPHPRMLERAFVLKPLADIAPALKISAKTIAEWLECSDQAGIEKLDIEMPWWLAKSEFI